MTTADEDEAANTARARDHVRMSHTPGEASAVAVAPLRAPGNRSTVPTSFAEVHTLEEHAEDHGKLMRQVSDLRLVENDVLLAEGDRVAVRDAAEGHHRGASHGTIARNGRETRWTAAAPVRAQDGKPGEFIKEWNRPAMRERLGWPVEACLAAETG